MNKFRKIISSMLVIVVTVLIMNVTYAASVSIKAAKTTATVGDKVKVTVTVKAAAWNLIVSGSASGDIIGFNMDAVNQTTTKTYTVTCSKAGTYTVKVAGDVTDENSEIATSVNKSVTITVKEKTTTSNNNTTTTTKSSNCNLSKLTISVEGLSFKSNQTTYNINVGADVDNITVKATTAHAKATYTVSGNKNLKAGNNVIKVVVKAENGATKTYKINVEKAGDIEETSSALTNLIIEGITFEEPFEKIVTEYIGGKIEYTEKLNVLAYTEAEGATFEVIGADELKVGENEVIVKVTSLDESTTTEYKVTFEMLAKEEEDAMQTVGPNVTPDNEITTEKDISLLDRIKDNALTILVYILAWVEFAQVIYLYVKLEKTKKQLEEKKTRNGAKENG